MQADQQFADVLIRFIRSFGLHQPERTPCGVHTSVAEAHALSDLALGSLRLSELATRLRLTKSTVSRLVDGLVERGWVERRPVAGDGRGVMLALTEEGESVAARIERARAQRLKALLDAIPPARRSEVIEVLRLMGEAARASEPAAVAN
jgi:DNA-binding MarR family transcriptional regulator